MSDVRFVDQPVEVQAGGGQAAGDQVRPVLDLFQLPFDDAGQARQVGGGEVGQGPFEQAPDAFLRIDLGRVRRQMEDRQPVLVLLGEGCLTW